MRKINLAIVGCGIVAKEHHYPALNKLKEKYNVVAVNSKTRKNAEKFSDMFENHPRVFDTYDDLLAWGEFDAVDLALPTEYNVEFIQKALINNKSVFCEKPIAVNTDESKKILGMSALSSNVVYIAENFRHINAHYRIKKIIDTGKIGKLQFIIWKQLIGMKNDNKYVGTLWRKKPKHIGGFLSDGGVHHIAAIRIFMGEIESVYAKTKKVSDYLGGDDTLFMTMNFKEGYIGSYTVSYALGDGRIKIDIYGDSGSIKIRKNYFIVETEKEKLTYKIPRESSFANEFLDFYRVFNGAVNIMGDPLEAIKDLAVIEAGVSSSVKGKEVAIKKFL